MSEDKTASGSLSLFHVWWIAPASKGLYSIYHKICAAKTPLSLGLSTHFNVLTIPLRHVWPSSKVYKCYSMSLMREEASRKCLVNVVEELGVWSLDLLVVLLNCFINKYILRVKTLPPLTSNLNQIDLHVSETSSWSRGNDRHWSEECEVGIILPWHLVELIVFCLLMLQCGSANLPVSLWPPILLRTHCHNSRIVGGHVTIIVKIATSASVDNAIFIGLHGERSQEWKCL
jgi:hypothetical protein